MKVVIDTNVWVSALINPNGMPARIINHSAAFDLLTASGILTELEPVLHYDRIQKRLVTYQGIPILTPGAFLAVLAALEEHDAEL